MQPLKYVEKVGIPIHASICICQSYVYIASWILRLITVTSNHFHSVTQPQGHSKFVRGGWGVVKCVLCEYLDIHSSIQFIAILLDRMNLQNGGDTHIREL